MTFAFADRLGVVTRVGSGAERSEAALTCSEGTPTTEIKPGDLCICFFSYRLFSDVLLTTSEKPQFKVKQII